MLLAPLIVGVDVAPLAGAWIEILSSLILTFSTGSLPSRERGLKSPCRGPLHIELSSLPSRERGLKLFFLHVVSPPYAVAPLAGAWIEIIMS